RPPPHFRAPSTAVHNRERSRRAEEPRTALHPPRRKNMSTSRSPGSVASFRRAAGLATVLLLAATGAGAQTGAVAGSIAEASTGRPLQQVRVQIVGNEAALTVTDANGRFLIRNLVPGQVTLRAVQIGYRPETRPLTIQA